jgi:hypothetical protein
VDVRSGADKVTRDGRAATTNERLRCHFEQVLEDAQRGGDANHVVYDLRAFNVVFA